MPSLIRLHIFAFLMMLPVSVHAVDDVGWLTFLSSELKLLDQQQQITRAQLDTFGAPVIGQTAPQLGYQHQRLAQPPLTPPWVQIDLEDEIAIDRVALIPAVLDWQSDSKRTYGFPPRFRIDLANTADFAHPQPVVDCTEYDVPDPGIAPLVFTLGHRRARYVRLTVTKLAAENGQYFYAMGELVVLSGIHNLAVGRPVTASSGMDLPPRWTLPNLVDGRTPLGPPITVESTLLPWDGLYAGATTTEPFSFMALDLGRELPLQEIRLYATHARLGADIPGFSFPLRFRIEAGVDADFNPAATLLDSTSEDYPNPGDNSITIRTPGITARHVRIALPVNNQGRFGLSEIEVYSGDRNVARSATVTSTIDPFNHKWPRSLLVDGYTSYGKLMDLPGWLDAWAARARLEQELSRMDAQRPALVAAARQRWWWVLAATGGSVLLALSGWLVVSRRRRARDLQALRRRLARDLHDEVGSNLAAIARLSELGAMPPTSTDAADWLEVGRIATESMEGMREVLWLAGAREEAGPDLATQVHRLVKRLLGGLTVRWGAPLETLPMSWSPMSRRDVFLFIKEALTNIVRHAQAQTVDLTFMIDATNLRLEICDDGKGFNPSAISGGMGLASLRERARSLRGTLLIAAAPGKGTRILLTVPVASMQGPGAPALRVTSVQRPT